MIKNEDIKVLIKSTNKVKTVVESEIILGVTIYYMSDNTSYNKEDVLELNDMNEEELILRSVEQITEIKSEVFKEKCRSIFRDIDFGFSEEN